MTARFIGAVVTAFLVLCAPGLVLRYIRGVARAGE
jgi:hypothetical protein